MIMYEISVNGDLGETDHSGVVADTLDHLSVQLSINEEGDRALYRCSGCGEETDQDDIVTFGVEECDGYSEIEIHEWEAIPLNWVNSASIHARTDRDEIQVTISVGDPRGAFVMAVERREDGLYLSVPHAGMGMSHMPLTERSAGWYKIG